MTCPDCESLKRETTEALAGQIKATRALLEREKQIETLLLELRSYATHAPSQEGRRAAAHFVERFVAIFPP